jgi:uncharacterized protein (DUF849 family)
MVPTKADNPHVPVTPDEVCEDVRRCLDAGASVFHVHAREADGAPAYEASLYRDFLARIRAACGDELVLCVSTSGRNFPLFEQRSAVLDDARRHGIDMASLTLGSMNFPRQASVNEPDMIARLAGKMRDEGVVPELEVFELGMIDYSHYLIGRGVLAPPLYYNLLLGSLGTIAATPLNLAVMVNALPAGATWAATGIGRFQLQVNAQAISMGGHVRVGLEDALYMDPAKTEPASNLALVERLVRVARAVGREPASPAEARRIIGLPAAGG